MQFVLVSACLLGEPVRYDGGHKRSEHAILQRWLREGRVVAVCPEVAGGLPTPRPPAEISAGAGGARVLSGAAKVVDARGADWSAEFVRGAQYALARAEGLQIQVAVLKEGSPSCGSALSHDGSFTGRTVPRPGVTTALLRQTGIEVFSESQLEQADALLKRLASADAT